MTHFQKTLVIIFVILGGIFLYILKSGFEFHSCQTGGRSSIRFEVCRKYLRHASSSRATPLKPDKETYNIGEKITYGYLTIKVISVDKSYNGMIAVDVYAYNDEKNTGLININNDQFYLERPDKSRVEAYSIGENGYNKTLKPDEGVTVKIVFRDNSINNEERNNLNILKIIPFPGSPSLTIDLDQ